MTAWNLSCPDWQERLKAGRSLVPDLPLCQAQANRAVAIYDRLRLSDVGGTPANADAAGDWFRDVLRALFGSYDQATRRRMVRELLLLVPKKNNKTTGGAHLMLTALLLNQRPRANFILTAPTHDTADAAYDAIAGSIALDDVLSAKLWVRDHKKQIVHRETQATLEIMTFDPAVMTGLKVSGGALIDELHEIAYMSKAAKALRQVRGGMLPFPEAFLVFITTQSDGPPVGIFRDELTKARAIRDGKAQGNMLPVLYEFPEELQKDKAEPWRDPALWSLVTPNLGRSIELADLKTAAKTAQETSRAEFMSWCSQHLNLQMGLAKLDGGWAGADYWEVQSEEGLTLEDLIAQCDVATVGIDGGGLDDLLGLCVLGRARVSGHWLAWFRAWAHPSVLERRKDIASHLEDFAKDGDLVLVKRIGDDVREVAEIVAQVNEAGLLVREDEKQRGAVGLDPVCVGAIVEALLAAGIEHEQLVAVSQGWRLAGPIKTTERKLAEGVFWHAGTPLMNWCVGNARIEPRGNAVMITKQISGTAKIDPLMAGFDAVQLMQLVPESAGNIDDFIAGAVVA